MTIGDQASKVEVKQKFIERLIANFLDIIIMTHFYEKAFNTRDVASFVRTQFGESLGSSRVHSTIHAMERKGLLASAKTDGTIIYRLTEKGKLTADVTTEPNEIASFMQKLMAKKA